MATAASTRPRTRSGVAALVATGVTSAAPPTSIQPPATMAPSASSLAPVVTFCSTAPQPTPKWLTAASSQIIAAATTQVAHAGIATTVASVSANATASAASVPVLITSSRHQP